VAAAKIPSEEQALAAGTKQNLSNLLFLDIYEGLSRVAVIGIIANGNMTEMKQCIHRILRVQNNKTAYLKVENSAQTTFSRSPIHPKFTKKGLFYL
jgi:hypothetical protein